MNKQPKSTIESMPTCILVTILFQFVLFSPELISTIRKKETFSNLFKNIFSNIENYLYLFGFGILIVILFIIHIVYTIRKKTVIKFGTKHSGKIIESLSNLSQISRKSTIYYVYKVKLEDNRIVFTQKYLDNEIERFNLRTCTVYEYKGKFVFYDFQ